MQKRFLLFISTLALLSGCDNSKKEVASPTPATETPKTVNIAPPPLTPTPQLAGIKPQPIAAASAISPNLIMGEKVYKSTCSICHKSGLNGAPRMGIKKDWEKRLAQGNEILYSRAINGYRGSKGSMPSRGSNPKLSEAEVKAAVDYIVDRAIPSWSVE